MVDQTKKLCAIHEKMEKTQCIPGNELTKFTVIETVVEKTAWTQKVSWSFRRNEYGVINSFDDWSQSSPTV